MLARRSKVDPLSDCPLGDAWKVVEVDLDRKMSSALIKCFFTYRGAAWGLSSSKTFVKSLQNHCVVEAKLLFIELKVNG